MHALRIPALSAGTGGQLFSADAWLAHPLIQFSSACAETQKGAASERPHETGLPAHALLCDTLTGRLNPFFAGLEPWAAFAHGFSGSEDLLGALIQIQWLAAGLIGVERGVHVHLDRIAFWILEVHRPRIAMVDLINRAQVVLFGESVESLEILQRVQEERQLVDGVERQVSWLPVEQYQLVVYLWILGHEKQPMTRGGYAFVADDEAQLAAVELNHVVQIAAERAGVSEIDSGQSGHCLDS